MLGPLLLRLISLPPGMIAAIRAAILKPQDYCSHLKTAFFHSTSILQRKHQSNWKVRNKRLERRKAKQDLRRNVNAFAEHLFGIWNDGFDYSGKNTSWFQKQFSRVCKRNRNGRHNPQHFDKRCFNFSEMDEASEVEYFLRNALNGSWPFSWPNAHQEGGARSGRFSNNFRKSWSSRYRFDQEEEDEYSSRQLRDTEPSQESHRQTLGLSSSGPLDLEDVKIAYRACALKWHPDRHDASTKDAAEEKFKLCTVAYQSLCEKLATN